MRFLEYLFFKYYNWAIKVGDGDCPATTSVICISFCISLWFMDAVMTWCFFISPMSSFGVAYGFVFPSVFVVSFLVLYIVLVAKGKEQTIIEKHKDEWLGKRHLGAVLFAVIPYFVFGVELFIKMLMNRGVI